MAGPIYLGRYEVVRQLGEGGMGKVYLARQVDNGRDVVVKVMHEQLAADARFRQNFVRETRLMERFHHPHAVALYEASVDDLRQLCIVMEYVPGSSLEEIVKREGPLLVQRAGRLLGQLCSVLQAAHGAGILHRDLTAANMMVVANGTPTEKLKVMDFGLARPGGTGPYFALEKLTGSGHSIGGGTPDYVCPEQIRGEEVDHRGDLYSVGILLFFLLTGQLPFQDAATVDEILNCHLDRKPPSFAEVGAGDRVAHGIEAVVQSCLAKYPSERPQSARELGERFEKALGHKIMVELVPQPPAPALLPGQPALDPGELVDQLEAWMPESIAVVKLRGFVGDLGGEIVDSEPGLIRVRLAAPGIFEEPKAAGFLGWLGLRLKTNTVVKVAVMELHMQKKPEAPNRLAISVIMRPEKPEYKLRPPEWKEWTEGIVRELRAYLIGR